MQQTDANHCTTACTTNKSNCTRLVQTKISIVCELHCLPAACEHMRRACRPCRMVSEVFMRACMPRCSQAFLGHQTTAASTKSASLRCSPSPPHRCWRTLASCANRRNAQFINGASFRHGTFNGDRRRPVCGPGCACGKRTVRSRHAARAFDRGMLLFSEKHSAVSVNGLSGGATHRMQTSWRGARHWESAHQQGMQGLDRAHHTMGVQPLWSLKRQGPRYRLSVT